MGSVIDEWILASGAGVNSVARPLLFDRALQPNIAFGLVGLCADRYGEGREGGKEGGARTWR
jgi:hypothetical protein